MSRDLAGKKTSARTDERKLPLRVFVLGVSILIVYALFTWWLLSQVDSNESTWQRLIYVYQGNEAIVYAALGALFGTVVQRGRIGAAEAAARTATDEAARNAGDAEAGRAMKAAVAAVVQDQDAVPPTASERIGVNQPTDRFEDAAALARYLLRMADVVQADQRERAGR